MTTITSKRVHRRVPEIVMKPLSEIVVDPNFRHDPKYLTLLQLQHQGKIKVGITRLPTSGITSGFFERRASNTVLVSDLVREHSVKLAIAIRQGMRPALTVYWSSLAPSESKFVCPDDEPALAAYRMLGIEMVPCIVLRPAKAAHSEASIWAEQAEANIRFVRAVAPRTEKFATFFGAGLPEFSEVIRFLRRKCRSTRQKVIAFHLDSDGDIHYHQMLHAVLVRHERILDSIRHLIRWRRVEHASAIVRVAYEAFLNFYLDWISPEFFGPRLQILSAIREREKSIDPLERKDAAEWLKILPNFEEILGKVSDKARISPLGSTFHNWIYPPLSLVSHQSYGHIEMEATGFSTEAPDDDPKSVQQLGRWLDLITAALVVRVQNEIGSR